ncbi:hypothetical protein C8Q80DRAFT_894235 [Daedaleopsis nitida]|nr:hypothetical protein C8Q80DRAFT_894235 [Daedaleopsis nitida]
MPLSAPHIPVEVAEKVIDQLADDYSSLRSCALTCQAWLPRSHVQLYHTVLMGDAMKLDLLRRVLKSSSMLSSLVYAVRVELGNRTGPSPDSAPLILSPLLPNLRSWTFHGNNHRWSPFQYSRPEDLYLRMAGFIPIAMRCLGRYSAIEELALVRVVFEDVAQLLELLIAFPALRSLRIQKTGIRYDQGINLDHLLCRLSERLKLSALHISEIACIGNGYFRVPSTLFRILQDVATPFLNILVVDIQELLVPILDKAKDVIIAAKLAPAILK